MRRLKPAEIERLPPRDREYYLACIEAGIEPELPSYRVGPDEPSPAEDRRERTSATDAAGILEHSGCSDVHYLEGNHEWRIERWALTQRLAHHKDVE